MSDEHSGINLMKKGNYEEAITYFSKTINDNKENYKAKVKAKVNKGICLYELQRHFEANRIFDEVVKLNCNHFEKGIAYFYLREYLKSIHSFYLANETEGNDTTIRSYIIIGQAYLEFSVFFDNLNEVDISENFESPCYLFWENCKKYLNSLGGFRDISNKEFLEDLRSLKICFDNYSCESVEKLIFHSRSLGVKYLENGIEKIDEELAKCNINTDKIRMPVSYVFSNSSQELIKLKQKESAEQISTLLYNKGVAFFSLKRYKEASEVFGCVICLDPSYARAFNNKGNALIKINNQSEEAIEAYGNAIKINPKYSLAYNNRGQVYYLDLKHSEASEDFESATTHNPFNYEAWTNKGILFFEQGKYEESKKALERALELNPDYALANTHLSKILFYLGDIDGAEEKIEKALGQNIKDTISWRLKGQISIEQGNYKGAVDAFESAIRYSSGDASLILWKAYVNYLYASHLEPKVSQGSSQNEESSVEQSNEAEPQHTNKDDGIKDSSSLKIVDELDPQEIYSSVIRELEMYLCLSEEHKGSLSKADRSLEIEPNKKMMEQNKKIKANTLYLLGCLYYKTKDYFKAESKLRAFINDFSSISHNEPDDSYMGKNNENLVKSAETLCMHISGNCIKPRFWEWWHLSSFRTISLIILLPFLIFLILYPLLYPIIIFASRILSIVLEEFFTEVGTQKYFAGNNSGNLSENLSYLAPGSDLYYVFLSIFALMFLSPYIASFKLKPELFEVEINIPKDLEFELPLFLAEDIAKTLDDIAD